MNSIIIDIAQLTINIIVLNYHIVIVFPKIFVARLIIYIFTFLGLLIVYFSDKISYDYFVWSNI